MSDFPECRFVDAAGVKLAVYESGTGAPDKPAVVLVHGWPEMAYSWKNQIPVLAAAGFRVIAPDLKGFGRSDAPREVAAYGIEEMSGDLIAMLDALGVERAVFTGHDWGGLIVWPLAQLHPDRVAGVIGVCTPHLPNPNMRPIESLKKRFNENHYIVQFQTEDTPEQLFETDIDRFFRIMFRRPVPRHVWPKLIPHVFDIMRHFRDGPAPDPNDLIVGEDDLAKYVEAYRGSGFRGGINLYRNMDRNFETMKNVDPMIRAPALWVGAELDLFLPLEIAELMNDYVPDLEKRVIRDCGHWVMWEQPDELNAHLVAWLTRHFG